jgi:acyl CoA:acetate/3-ketoacid CoA transferase beta subunit
MALTREQIPAQVAVELEDRRYVDLGVGMPHRRWTTCST